MKKEQIEKKKKEVIDWIKLHKKELIIAGISVAMVISIALCIKNREELSRFFSKLKNDVKRAYVRDKSDSYNKKERKNKTKYAVKMIYPDGVTDIEDDLYDSYEEAVDAALYSCSCYSQGCEDLFLSNPGDYPLTGDEADFRIIEIRE